MFLFPYINGKIDRRSDESLWKIMFADDSVVYGQTKQIMVS